MMNNLLSLSDPSRLLSVIIIQGTNSELSRYLEREGADIHMYATYLLYNKVSFLFNLNIGVHVFLRICCLKITV